MGEFELRVTEVLRRLRRGEVATYGEVAAEAGYPGAGRAVGNVLARSDGLPWWRVVTAGGRLVPGHEAEHARRLKAEGVTVKAGRVPASPSSDRTSSRRRRGPDGGPGPISLARALPSSGRSQVRREH